MTMTMNNDTTTGEVQKARSNYLLTKYYICMHVPGSATAFEYNPTQVSDLLEDETADEEVDSGDCAFQILLNMQACGKDD